VPEGVEFTDLFVVVAVAFLVPFVLGLLPSVRLPGVVLEIVAGIVLGPSVLGWVEADLAVQVLALVGLAFLLLLAGLEVDLDRVRGRLLVRPALGMALSFGLAAGVAAVLGALGLVGSPVLVAIILVTTALGIVAAVLKDAGVIATPLGQLVVASATLADVSAIILLSLLFSETGGGPGATVALLVGLVLLAVLLAVAVPRTGMLARVSGVFARLADTTAQIRVRGAVVLLVGFTALAAAIGIEVILGAFLAGLLLGRLDRDGLREHPRFRAKLDGIGYGFVIPVFFVASGLQFDLGSLLADPGALLLVPLFLVAMLLVRGAPALLYRGLVTSREVAVAGLLQATSLPFVVTATAIGSELGLLSPAVAAAMVSAGLLSVLVFPLVALGLLRPAPVARPETPSHRRPETP
jgi:Kef-type K+ transport system membrane component KefB